MNSKILFLAIAAVIIGSTGCFSQCKKTVAVVPFTSSSYKYKSYSKTLTESFVNVFVKSGRFNVVDRTNFDAIYSEENLQKGESFISGQVVEQGKKVGAQYIIAGNMASVINEKSYGEDSKGHRKFNGYTGRISFSIKIIDVETGQIAATETFNGKSGGISGLGLSLTTNAWPSKERAINKCIEVSEKHIAKFIDKQFPAMAQVFEISEQSRSKAISIVVAGGSDIGFCKGQDLKVIEIKTVEIGGRKLERKKEIGWVKIKNVEDENFSSCKVVRGGEAIKTRMNSNSVLWVISGNN